jgi:hypothetical protein
MYVITVWYTYNVQEKFEHGILIKLILWITLKLHIMGLKLSSIYLKIIPSQYTVLPLVRW